MQLPCRRLRRPRRVLRHWPAASCSAPMASRRLWLSVSPTTQCQDASRRRDRLVRHDSSGFDQGLLLSRRAPRGVSRSREAAALPRLDAQYAARQSSGASRRSAPAAPIERHGASVPNAGASPRPLRNALASRKRHPGVGAIPATAPHAGFPPAVRFPGLPESPPATPHKGGFKDGCRIAPAPKRHQKRTLSSPRRRWPQGRFSAPSLPKSRRQVTSRRTAVCRQNRRSGSDGACLSNSAVTSTRTKRLPCFANLLQRVHVFSTLPGSVTTPAPSRTPTSPIGNALSLTLQCLQASPCLR